MRTIPLCVLAACLTFTARSDGQVESKELSDLRAASTRQMQALRDMYQGKLEALLKAETAKGNLAAAVAIRAEMNRVVPGSAPAPSSGIGPAAAMAAKLLEIPTRWQDKNGAMIVEFKPGGIWLEHTKGHEAEGKWTREPDSELIYFESNSGRKGLYRMGELGKSIWVPGGWSLDRMTSEVTTAPTPVPATPPDKSGDDVNPFGNLR